jgi:hypothetical protein
MEQEVLSSESLALTERFSIGSIALQQNLNYEHSFYTSKLRNTWPHSTTRNFFGILPLGAKRKKYDLCPRANLLMNLLDIVLKLLDHRIE